MEEQWENHAEDVPAQGSLINHRYRVVRELGRGGMGSVTLVEDTLRDNQPLALKIVRQDQENPMVIEILKNEFEALSALRHPNISIAYDYGVIEGTGDNFFTSEFVEGINFYDGTESLDTEERLDLLVQVCRALEYVHSRGFIHHDLKPDNILLTGEPPNRIIKLIDFGLINREFLKSKSIIGTPHYMAPEKIRGMSTDRRVDIYALGVVAYLLFTRRLPFVGTDAIKVVRKHLVEAPLPPRCHASDLPEALEEVILRLLAKDPADRYFTGADVIRDINQRLGHSFEVETAASQESYIVTGRFVGREPEMEVLQGHLQGIITEGAERRGSAVLVRGESGIGKSRLLREFRHHVQLRGIPFLRGNCTRIAPFALQPFYRIFRELIPLAPEEVLRVPERRVEMRRILPDLLPDAPDEEDAPSLTGGEDALRLVHNLAEVILQTARRRPMVLFVNDLHWGDEVSANLFLTLCRRMGQGAGSGLLLIGTVREEELPGSPLGDTLEGGDAPEGMTEVVLRSLEEKEVHQLVSSMLGIRDIPPLFSFHLQEESQGNPLFVEEAMKVLLEEGRVSRSGSEWEFPLSFDDIAIPKTLPEVLQNRLRRLDPEEIQILRFCAVLDRPAPAEQISQLSGARPIWLVGILRNLERRQMMDASVQADSVEYSFIHDTLKELVYEGIPEEERFQLHLQLAEGLEAFYAKDPDAHVAEVAHHFLRSPERKKSVQYGLQAGTRLTEMHAYREAASIYRAVLGRLEGTDFAIRVRILGRLADISLLTGRYDEGIQVLEEMLRTGERLLNWKSRGVARAKIGGLHVRSGDPEAALQVLETALAEVEPHGDTVEKAHILATMGLAHLRRGDPEACLERCAQAAETARGAGRPQALAAMHNTAGMALYGLGRYEEALREYQAGLDNCRTAGNLQGEAASHGNIGTVLSEMGRESQAETALGMAVQIFEKVGDLRARAQGINNLAELHLRQGKLISARDLIRAALQIGEEISDPEILGRSRAIEGQVLTSLGQYDDAEAVLTLALRTAEESSAEREICQALIGLARLRAVWDPQEETQPEIGQAVRIGKKRKWPYLVGMALLQARDLKLCGQADRIFRSLKADREIAICALQRAHIYTSREDSMGAHHLIEEAEKRAGSVPSPALSLALLRERGRWLALEGMGVDELRQALALAQETQARPLALEISADLARTLQRQGDPEGAGKVASDASRLFREMMEHVPARRRPAYLRMPPVQVIREFLDSQPSS